MDAESVTIRQGNDSLMSFASKRNIEAMLPTAAAGLVAGIVVIAVSLPLHSPHDSLMNTGTIAIAVVATAIVISVAVSRLAESRNSYFVLLGVSSVAFILASIGAFVVQETQDLERTVSFVVPLAAIQFGLTALLSPLLELRRSIARWTALAAFLILLSAGFALAGQGDRESGRLELPPRTQQ